MRPQIRVDEAHSGIHFDPGQPQGVGHDQDCA